MSSLQDKELFEEFQHELAKGISDYKNGKVLANDEAMKLIRERVSSYGV